MNDGRLIAAGYYKARGLAGSEQYGTTDSGTDQIAIDVAVPEKNLTLTTFLFFTEAAAPYSIERLRTMGWKGNDLSKLVGIDANEITVQVSYEDYQGKAQMRVDIVTSQGRVTLRNQMSDAARSSFAKRMQAFVDGTAKSPPGTPPSRAPAGGRRPFDDLPPFDPDAGVR